MEVKSTNPSPSVSIPCLHYKTFYSRYVAVTLKARVFANVRHFHPSLTFGAKLTLVRSATPVSSSLACKNLTMLDVTNSVKHASLLLYVKN